jgi:hypothetical protein
MTAPSPPPTPPAEWQRAYEEGRLASALAAARAAAPDDLHALRWRALAAFRLGEMVECADAALRLIPLNTAAATMPAEQDSVLSVSVVASCETLRFEQALSHLQPMLALAKRAGDLVSYVRARGSAANCFALMGDPWAAQRLLGELAGFFMAGGSELPLEATVRGNLCATYLMIAQWARQAQDEAAAQEAMAHADTNVQRCRELAALSQAPRVKAFADVHAAELAILRGLPRQALGLLASALHDAEQAGLWAHVRALRLTQAEAALDAGDAALAQRALDAVAVRLDEGHEITSRIRYHRAMQAWHAAQDQLAEAMQQAQTALALEQRRRYAQFQAQSRYLRTRLELEHLYRYRSSRSVSTTTQPGALGR